jgi:hypothetical protein
MSNHPTSAPWECVFVHMTVAEWQNCAFSHPEIPVLLILKIISKLLIMSCFSILIMVIEKMFSEY